MMWMTWFGDPTDTPVVDPKTGHINLKKGEAWISTFTPIVTYLLRCNSDVTSLLSGTAIKAVIAYVTDYVSKSPLKTYGIFESIRNVFDRNTEMLNSEKPRHEKACKLLTSIVNPMTTKMEIGAPMASAYLLEQPHHYTSHKFKPFYWLPFSVLPIQKDQVVLGVMKGNYAAFSAVSDYTLGPEFYEDITVYDWMRQAHKEKVQVKLPPPDKDDEMQVDLEGEHEVSDYDTEDEGHEDYNIDQEDSDDTMDDNEITLDDMRFIDGHPQRDSHRVKFLPNNKGLVPSFVGGVLPRSDKGDHEYYCATMLTLFKPWHTGFDLKKDWETWTEAFTSHTFTD
ncbi:hypothetical protein K439DRAFT_1649214 [Ramaria rubella]|nr:hypothetical protein K439DRAFT_1649214 [Ramaria rubella]